MSLAHQACSYTTTNLVEPGPRNVRKVVVLVVKADVERKAVERAIVADCFNLWVEQVMFGQKVPSYRMNPGSEYSAPDQVNQPVETTKPVHRKVGSEDYQDVD